MHLFMFATLAASIISVGGEEPNRQPSLASAPGLTAVVFGNGNSIWISTSKDDGQHFSPPTEVARVPALTLGRHRGPRVAISGSTVVVTAMYGDKSPKGHRANELPWDGDLVAWHSTDGGHSWSKPVVINDVPGSAREGLHGFAGTGAGQFAAAWLDLRAPGTRLVGAYSKDNGQTWSRNRLLYEAPGGSICQCCAPSLAFGQNGQATAMFRNIMDGSRDLFFVRWDLEKGPSESHKLGSGTWTLNACPMDGGAIAQRGDAIVTAWRRDKTVYLDDPGRPEKAIGKGKDVTLAMGAHGPYVAWTGQSGIELYQPEKGTVRSLSSSGAFATAATLPDNSVLLAWEEGGRIQLEKVR
jgi:hypothetical protein